ncbi:hypothetical protein FMN63_19500 [Stappia sp. BW2]|jgi:hypothetical protein|uniref:hypothetical protein n=1 Tax=Stappia sp. BW2 TaxID=2592622 RepID=UPI0011DEB5A1|nr:hypothetical protein [Stappia sp. BW2]TYC64662.1 hypothetical protein FMN63_19500 [Stappia sp. BW2]
MLKTSLSKAVALSAFFISQAPALAADLAVEPTVTPARVVEDRWNFSITPYFWMAGLGGETVTGDNITMPFNKVIENLSFALMTSISAEKGRFGVYSDLIYMNLEGSKTTTATLVRRTIDAKLDATIKGFITTNSLGYKIVDTPSSEIAGFGGFRYLWLSTDLDFSLGNFSASASDQGQVIDAVVGLRGETKLSDRWSVAYYGDVGTGQSDVTWQLFGAIGYEIKNIDLFAGYRYIGWRFDDVADLDALDTYGPVIGARFKF